MKVQMKFTVLAALLAFGVSAQAANTITFGGVGSSAMFNSFRSAALTLTGGTQATNAYQASNAGQTVDGSNADTGNLWVVWAGPANDREIFYYLSVDSTVGVRSYFNSATLNVLNVAPASGFAALPADVRTSIQGTLFTAGMTDVTAADAKVGTSRLLSLGYSATNTIKGLNSAGTTFSGETKVIDFSLSARPYQTTSIGAAPVLVFVNNTLSGAGDIGETGPSGPLTTNINRYTLAGFLDGTFTRTTDLTLQPNTGKPVTTFLREGLSGTYLTMEYCIPQSVFTSQERNVSSTLNNPLNGTTPAYNPASPAAVLTKGGRVRGVGTAACVAGVNRTPNSLGYSFWSTGNFAIGVANNTKYITVDGVEPLLDVYPGGNTFNYPSGSAVTFKNISNGSYPIWGVLRMITSTAPADGSRLSAYVTEARAASNGGTFIPPANLYVFRSHRATKDAPNPSNGNNTLAEAGADAGGAVFNINSDKSFFADTGKELINLRLGDTRNRGN